MGGACGGGGGGEGLGRLPLANRVDRGQAERVANGRGQLGDLELPLKAVVHFDEVTVGSALLGDSGRTSV